METDDQRPVVLQTGSPDEPAGRRRPRPRTVLALGVAALVVAGGVVAGSWCVWSTLHTTPPSGDPPAPLWFSPPALTPGAGIPSLLSENPAAPTTSSGNSGGSGHRAPGSTANRPTPTSSVPERRGEGEHAGPNQGGGHRGPH